jgi:hypothetical protein
MIFEAVKAASSLAKFLVMVEIFQEIEFNTPQAGKVRSLLGQA